MERRKGRMYPEEFKKRVFTAYCSSDKPVSVTARRLEADRDTVDSRFYRKRRAGRYGKGVKPAPLKSAFMKGKGMSEEGNILAYGGTGAGACGRKDVFGKSGKEEGHHRRGVKNRHRKKIRYQTVHPIRQERTLYRTDTLCRLSGKSRPACYECSRYVAARSAEEDTGLSPVREVRKDFPPAGAEKLPVYLRFGIEVMHIHIGRDAFIELPYRNFMPVRRYGNRRKTVFSGFRTHRYPGLTADCTPVAPNRLRVSDSAYIEADDSHGGLSLITDACSHRVTGWNLSPRLRPSGASAALKMVLSSLKGKHPELIRYADRGSQHGCRDYISHSKGGSLQISTTEGGNPRENAMTARISGILKTEWIYGCKPDSWQETPVFVNRIIDLHNSQRPYRSISYITPAPVHQTGGKTEYRRENYYRNGSIPVKKKTGKNGGKSSGPKRVKVSYPIEEGKVLQQGNSATATPPLHCLAANRKTGNKQTNRIIQKNMITFVANCKAMAGRKQSCQVHAGRRKKICKEISGQDTLNKLFIA